MNQTYIEKSINCRECNEKMANLIIEPEEIILEIKCSKDHRHKIKIDRRSWEIKTLIEKNEEN